VADLIQNVVEQIPYTIPWWQRLFKAWERAPERYYRRLNTIVDMFEWYCQDHALVYIQTMLPALGETVLALLAFDWDDVVRGFLRPSGPYARKSLVFDPRKAKWEWEIPELGEEIGKRIPGAKLIKANKIWGKTRFLWVIDGLIQRVLYYFLILDIVTEFLYNWSSAVLRALSECGAAYYARGTDAMGIQGLKDGISCCSGGSRRRLSISLMRMQASSLRVDGFGFCGQGRPCSHTHSPRSSPQSAVSDGGWLSRQTRMRLLMYLHGRGPGAMMRRRL
jgi:hypothetical protein